MEQRREMVGRPERMRCSRGRLALARFWRVSRGLLAMKRSVAVAPRTLDPEGRSRRCHAAVHFAVGFGLPFVGPIVSESFGLLLADSLKMLKRSAGVVA